MKEFPLASQAGITKRSIRKAISNGVNERDLFHFIHGDVNLIHSELPKASGFQPWETTGKRYVHIEEARFVARHFLRNGIQPSSRKALVLAGTDPALACLPWAMSGIASRFVAYENDYEAHYRARRNLSNERRKVRSRLPAGREFRLKLIRGDVFEINGFDDFGVIDLDFCNNRLRNADAREKLLSLIDRASPLVGPFVLRTTLHMGRVDNSREDVERHIEKFEKEIRDPRDPDFQSYRIRASDRSPYQSSLPMVSLVWILERQPEKERGEVE